MTGAIRSPSAPAFLLNRNSCSSPSSGKILTCSPGNRQTLPGVPREVIEHHLAVCPGARPVKQKVRRQAQDRQDFVCSEVKRLKKANFIREVLHPTWVANPVVVPKPNGSKRMCIDFTDLNKACPKDPFPLPRIDQIVDSTAGCDLLCFLDAFSGYHQIKMAVEDEEKTAFITPEGCFCYTCMPFGLKNAGATFQRAMRTCLGSQMGRNVEAYIDDIVVKTKDKDSLVPDLEETFCNLRRINLKLNPEKCAFGVPSGKLLGFMVSHRGIEANPDKIEAIERIEAPKRIKEVQRLNGCVTALGRFISRLGERALPFFKLLKKSGPVKWTPEAEAALQDLKKYLASPPVMVAPRPAEPLMLYVSATTQVVSAVLVAEREEAPGSPASPGSEEAPGSPASPGSDDVPGKGDPPGRVSGSPDAGQPEAGPSRVPTKKRLVQRPVYFVSSVLRDARERYPEIQKLLLGVLIASRKLRHYFEAHRITVVTSYPLERVLHNRSATGRIAEWSLELSGFDLHFANTTSIKSRALADFIAEWTPTPGSEEEAQSSLPGNEDPECWTMYFDGSFSIQGAGAGVLLISPTGERLKYVVQMLFDEGRATNNTAEYEGLLAGLRAAAGLGIKRLIVRGDSQLVINQVTKEYECPQMAAYVDAVRKMEHHFSGLQFEHVPRAMNEIADQLSKLAARREPAPPGTFVERLSRPSIAPDKLEPQGACNGPVTVTQIILD